MTKTKLTDALPGQKIGRLMITEEYVQTEKNEKKYLCRCECGNEKYILEKSPDDFGIEFQPVIK